MNLYVVMYYEEDAVEFRGVFSLRANAQDYIETKSKYEKQFLTIETCKLDDAIKWSTK